MSHNWIDQPTSIRKGEELDRESLQRFLLKELEGASGELVIEQFPGGASNLTYLIKLGEQDLVLRRPPFGANIKSAHDMGREYRVLSALSKHYSKAPVPLLYTENKSIIGDSFYVMERVKGIILRKAKGPARDLEQSVIFAIADSLMETLAELHALDYHAIGLGELGKPLGYAERQVKGWIKRYMKAKTDEYPEVEKVAEWLNARIPSETDSSLVHNDFKHDNVILDADDITKVIAILDWEMCTLGDPLMDFGTTLGYWPDVNDPPLLKMLASAPSSLPGNPSRRELVQMYASKSGRNVDNIVFYYAFGLFKIAVILQQIYARFKLGFTQDPRFAQMNLSVEALGRMALRAIEKDRIDDLF